MTLQHSEIKAEDEVNATLTSESLEAPDAYEDQKLNSGPAPETSPVAVKSEDLLEMPAQDESIYNEKEFAPDQSKTSVVGVAPPEESAAVCNPISQHSPTHVVDGYNLPECNVSTLESSTRSDEMDESMFMPNISMEVSLVASPVPVVAPEQQLLQPTLEEEDEDSAPLSDEEFFPNRDLSRKNTSKVAVSASSKEEAAPSITKNALESHLSAAGNSEHDTSRVKENIPSKASRRSHPITSKPSMRGSVSQTNSVTGSRTARQNSQKTAPPKTPPSTIKPAKKRTRLSTITNTADSPKRTSSTLKPKTTKAKNASIASSATAAKGGARPAPKEVNTKPTVNSTSQSKLPQKPMTAGAATQLIAVSPRTSSIRRSLVAVAKSQRQLNIPKPKSSTKGSVSRSERLSQLAKPRNVVQKKLNASEQTTSQNKLVAAKPPSFLSRESSKKSMIKSTEEREVEEMSSRKPFKASKIKGSTAKVRSRFNTPRAPSANQTCADKDNAKPFKSLREEIDSYNFREPAAAVITTPVNPQNLTAPSFFHQESTKAPKQNVTTLGESLRKYDFRAAPIVKTPINPRAKPPSFLARLDRESYSMPKSSEELELEECQHKFKACPLPISSTSRSRPLSRPREGRSLTTPRPPKLHTSTRSDMKTPILTQDDIELQKQFHARPLPVSLYGSGFTSGTPLRYYEKTPQPSTDEIELRKKFHALPLPTEIYGRAVDHGDTPFHVRAEQQYERAMERKKQMLEHEMEQLRKSRTRKATPLPPTNWEARPIRIEKSDKELVQPRPPRLSLDARSRDRKQFDDHVQQTRDAEAAADAARRQDEARAEEEEVRRRRSLSIEEGGLCFRARPVSIRYE
jgi:hypothetical protein